MNKLERIASIIILSAIPYVTNAQTTNSQEYSASIPKELPKDELLARNTIYRSRTNYNYENEEEKITHSIVLEETPITAEKKHFEIKYFDIAKFKSKNSINNIKYYAREEDIKLLNTNLKNIYPKMTEYNPLKQETENYRSKQILQVGLNNKACYDTYKKNKSLGHDYEYHLGKHTGLYFEEGVKFNDGKFHLDHFAIKLVYHIGK